MVNNENLEGLIIRAAMLAGAHIRESALIFKLSWKKEDDPVTNLDREAEIIIKNEIKGFIKDANFLGEEYGAEDNKGEYTFIIDPIDGTKSFIRREYNCATSIGVEKDSKLVAGCVYDFMRDIMYVRGSGKGSIIHNNNTHDLYKKIGEGFRMGVWEDPEVVELFKRNNIKSRVQTGSIALELAHVASGTIDGIQYPGNHSPWDIAGGIYLLMDGNYHIMGIQQKEFDHRKNNSLGGVLHKDAPDFLIRFNSWEEFS